MLAMHIDVYDIEASVIVLSVNSDVNKYFIILMGMLSSVYES